MKFAQYSQLLLLAGIAFTEVVSAVPQDLVDGLGDESYQLREKSEQDLTLWAKKNGEKGLDELNEIRERARSPEVKSRIENVMSGVTIYKAIPGTQGFMGISMQSIMGGSLILSVSPDTPAEKSGLQPNDKIVELDGINLGEKNNHIEEATDFLRRYVKSKKAGEKLSLKIERDGEVMTKTLKLADYDEQMARLGMHFQGQLDPFGNFNGPNPRVIPVPGAGGRAQGNLRIIPAPAKRNINPEQLMENEIERLELQLEKQQKLFEHAEIPDNFKEMLKQQNERQQQRIEQLKKQLNLKEKKIPKK